MKHFLTFIILSLFLLTSCKEFSKDQNAKTVTDNFQLELAKRPKLFLKFWEGMSKQDYEKVVDTLIKEKVLSGSHYVTEFKIGYCQNVFLYSVFEEDSLTEIRLRGEGNCLYKLYKEKYDLPELIKRHYKEMPKKGFLNSSYTEFVLSEVPTLIEKGENIIFLDYQELRDYRKEHPDMPYALDFGGSYGNIFVYYKTKKAHLIDQKRIFLEMRVQEQKNKEETRRYKERSDKLKEAL